MRKAGYNSPQGGASRRLTTGFLALCAALSAVRSIAVAQPARSVYEEAVSYLQRGESGSAIALLEPTLQQSPADLKARTLLGMALAAAGRHDEAKRQFEQTLRTNPLFAPALKNLAVDEMALGEVSSAKLHFERLLQLTPADPVAHLALAEIDFEAKLYQTSLSHYEKSGDLYLKDPRNVLKFAQACAQLKQTAKAIEVLGQMSKEADAATHFEAGTLLATLADYVGAARELELARNGYPDAYAAGYNLALAYIKSRQFPRAIQTSEELIAGGYRKAELYNLLAQAYEESGKTKDAYDALRTATQVDPADEANYIDLIALCLNHKNYDLALEIADIGIARLAGSDGLQLQRGIVFAMKAQFSDAKAAFEKAAGLAPQKSLPHVALGLVLMQMDRVPAAIEILRRRIRRDPRDYVALWFLGEALNRAGAGLGSAEEKEAIDALERSVKLHADVAQPRVLLAKLLARGGQLDRAETQLERALAIEPGNVTAEYQLAQVCSKKGDLARAKELFAKVGQAKAEDREQFNSRGLLQIMREGAR